MACAHPHIRRAGRCTTPVQKRCNSLDHNEVTDTSFSKTTVHTQHICAAKNGELAEGKSATTVIALSTRSTPYPSINVNPSLTQYPNRQPSTHKHPIRLTNFQWGSILAKGSTSCIHKTSSSTSNRSRHSSSSRKHLSHLPLLLACRLR